MENSGALGAVLTEVRRRIPRRDLAVFCGSLCTAFLVHLYGFTHKFVNHDDINELYYSVSSGLESGRWLLGTVEKVWGCVSSPGVMGLLGAVWLALTVVLVVRIFRVRHLPAALAVGLCMVSYPTVVCTYSYMFTAPTYFFALFLAALGAYLLKEGGKWRFLGGAACVALAMGIYQAYIALPAALLVSAFLVEICEGRWDSAKALFLALLRALLGLVCVLALYFVMLRLCLFLGHMELTDYAGISGMGQITPAILLERTLLAYKRFFLLPREPFMHAIHRLFPYVMWMCMGLLLLAAGAAAVRRRLYRKPGVLLLLLVLAVLLPLACHLAYLMAEAWAVHRLMTYPVVLVWLLPAVAADKISLPEDGRWPRWLALGAAAFGLLLSLGCGYEGALITGKTYLSMDLSRTTAVTYFNRLAAKIELQEGYVPGAKVALFGDAQVESAVPDDGLTGVLVGREVLNFYSRNTFLRYFLGWDYGWVSEEEKAAIAATEAFQNMPCYPAEGSIATINGVIAVKFSEPFS